MVVSSQTDQNKINTVPNNTLKTDRRRCHLGCGRYAPRNQAASTYVRLARTLGDLAAAVAGARQTWTMLLAEENVAIPIELTPAQESRLRIAANRLGIAPEVLARLAVEDLLARPDADFQDAADRVLEKNRELYDRLA